MTIVTFNYIPGPKTSRTVSSSLFLADSLARGILLIFLLAQNLLHMAHASLGEQSSPFRLNLLVARKRLCMASAENCNEEPTQYIEGTPKRLAHQTNDGRALFGL